MPFVFNAVELYPVTINEKPQICARDLCRALEYGKATQAADVVKHLCSSENYTHKWQLTEHVSETNSMDWPKDSRKDVYYINEEGMYEIVFKVNSQRQEISEGTVAMCCFPMFGSNLQTK